MGEFDVHLAILVLGDESTYLEARRVEDVCQDVFQSLVLVSVKLCVWRKLEIQLDSSHRWLADDIPLLSLSNRPVGHVSKISFQEVFRNLLFSLVLVLLDSVRFFTLPLDSLVVFGFELLGVRVEHVFSWAA